MATTLDILRNNKRTNVRMMIFRRDVLRMALTLLEDVSLERAVALAEKLFLTPRRHEAPGREKAALKKARPYALTVDGRTVVAWTWRAARAGTDVEMIGTGDDEAGAGAGIADGETGRSRAARARGTDGFTGHPLAATGAAEAVHDPGATAPGRGRRVLLVHGWAGRAGQLHALAETLSIAGFTVVAIDAPAHGHSEGRETSMPGFVRAIQEADRVLGPFHAVVGHSMGGAATLLALREGLATGRAVVLGAPSEMEVALRGFARTFDASHDLVERLRARIEARFALPFAALRVPAFAARMTVPLLVVHDADDAEIPVAEGEAIAAAWPDARLRRTTGLGHHRILRDAAVLREILGFLTGDRRGTRLSPVKEA